MGADADGRQVLLVVAGAGLRGGAVGDAVDGADGEVVVEDVAEQLVGATDGAMADEDQAEGQLLQPGLGDGELEEDAIGGGGEGVFEGLLGFVGLLVDELAADLVLVGEVADGLCAGEGVDRPVLALLGRQGFGGDRVGRAGGCGLGLG